MLSRHTLLSWNPSPGLRLTGFPVRGSPPGLLIESVALPPSVSVIIPTKNAGPGFEATLDAVRRQQGPRAELVVVDSGSADGTVALARRAGARVIEIPPASFNHGETRNLGIRAASGEICVLLVQDALPAADSWLEQMIAPFAGPETAGVSGGQLSRPGAGTFARWELAYHRRVMGDEPRVFEIRGANEFLQLPFEERARRAGFNNVTSALRRSVWERIPFRRLAFGEDLDWGARALHAGWRLAYNPAAAVLHSHDRPALYGLRRQYVSCKVVPEILQMPVEDPGIPNDGKLFSLIAGVCREAEYLLREPLTDLQQIWDFGCNFGRRRSLVKQLWAALVRGAEQPCLNSDALREPFYDHIAQAGPFAAGGGPEAFHELVAGALARAVGTVAGVYVRWRQQQGALSPEMQRLDAALAAEV